MSIKIFYGNDRVKAQAEIRRLLGEGYEIIDGIDLEVTMMPSIFLGVSLFDERRRIVIKDLSENKAAFDKLKDFVGTEHDVIVWENNLDKRTTFYKDLVGLGVEVREFKMAEKVDMGEVFDIYKVAARDGGRAVKMLEKIQEREDPYMFTGLMVAQAVKDFVRNAGVEEKTRLKKLAKLDLEMKNSSLDAWELVKIFLLNLSEK